MLAIKRASDGKLLALVEGEEKAERFRDAVGCEVCVVAVGAAEKRAVLQESRDNFTNTRRAHMEERLQRLAS